MRHELFQEEQLRVKLENCVHKSTLEAEINTYEIVQKLLPIIKEHLPTKPKVSLEELVKVVGQATIIFDETVLSKELDKAIVQAIFAHLGIELEPDKEDWEMEFEDFQLKAARIGEGYTADDIAKAMFEAGQRSKEK